ASRLGVRGLLARRRLLGRRRVDGGPGALGVGLAGPLGIGADAVLQRAARRARGQERRVLDLALGLRVALGNGCGRSVVVLMDGLLSHLNLLSPFSGYQLAYPMTAVRHVDVPA